jgi:cell wall assembly regulator SMI1
VNDDPIDGPVLTEAALDRLEAGWRMQKAPISRNLRPGLSATELQQRGRDLQLGFPPEACLWWQWHDGTSGEPMDWLTRVIGPGIECLTFNGATRHYKSRLGIADDLAASIGCDPANFWDRNWFPIATRSFGVLAVDCASPGAARTPVLVVEHGTDQSCEQPKATCLGALVALWTQALEQRWWTYDPDTASWEQHLDRIPDEYEYSRLV